MIKLFLITFFAWSLYGMEIDYKTLEEIVANNPKAIKERVILAKYYEKNSNDLKAMNLVDEVLHRDAKNKNALAIKDKIQTKERVKGIFREAGLATPIDSQEAQKRLDSYYKANNYQFYSNLYQALVDTDVKLEDAYYIKAAYIYLWDAHYNASEKALGKLKQTHNIDEAKIYADIYYYRGNYKHAAKLYEKLYSSDYNLETAIKLINCYVYVGKIQKAQRLQTFLARKYPNNKKLAKLDKKIVTSKNSYLVSLKKKYEIDKNINTLTQYTNALYAANKKDETLAVIHEYNKKKESKDSLLLEVKYLIWMGETKEALDILRLNKLEGNLAAKLMLGKIYSWDQEYEKSIKNLKDVIDKSQDKDMLFEAKNALAHVYLWQKKDPQAKKMFDTLHKERPNNKEVKEALMQLKHDYKGLLSIYKRKAYKSNNQGDMKYLAELYGLNKNYDMAIKTLKSYLRDNPHDLEASKTLGLMLIEKKEYYQGFGYLEYYAAEKQTAASGILLAQNYYWHGFSKEALDVLDKVIEKEKKNTSEDISLVENGDKDSDLARALKLKAEILKVAPRFTTSNSGATTATYYDDLGKKQLFLADTLYFNSHYKASLMYFQNYLQSHPNDHKARYRYAFALENAKEYGKAEGEFSLIFWTKDSDELRYHYAYNMMNNGKLDASKKLLLKLKESTYTKVDANITTFLDSWKSSWESLDFAQYASHYSQKFTEDEMWAFRKQATFSNARFISIGVYDPIEKKIGKNSYRVKFYQEYARDKKSDKGYKTLEIKCTHNKTECRITKELWKKGKYKKTLLLMPYIDKSLKENKYLKAHPLAFISKKKTLQLKNLYQKNPASFMIYT